MTPMDSAARARLSALAETVRADIRSLSFASQPWVRSQTHQGRKTPDVTILGAGQNGLVLGHALQRRGVRNIELLDRNPAGYEGVWETFARNHEFRSPKEISGAELGLPNLSVERFLITWKGQAYWDGLKRIPRHDWMAYLRWYREVTELPVINEAEVGDIVPDATGVSLRMTDGSTRRTRYLVLATGMDGGGAWSTPEMIRALPRDRWNHSSDIYDESLLQGKDVGILGIGAAALDTAVAALEAGAREVHMFMRRRTLPVIDVAREFENAGQLAHTYYLSDQTKWDISNFMSGLSQSPAEHHFLKACSFPNFRIHAASPWTSAKMDGEKIAVTTPRASFHFDHVFAATGARLDMTARPELRNLAERVALWGDRFTPPGGPKADPRLKAPYLTEDYRLQPRYPERDPGGLERIFAFNALATMTMGGMGVVSVSCHRFGVPRIAESLTRALFLDQEDTLVQHLASFDTPAIEIPPHVQEMLRLDDDPGAQEAVSKDVA